MSAPPLEDDDLLAEILLRLPPEPSSLPRASAVCKIWRSVASDPGFSRRFRTHHRRNPPLLGCIVHDFCRVRFQPTLEAPNRVPQARFSYPIAAGHRFRTLGCRHGLVLIFHDSQKQLLVWDPVTGDQHRLDIPLGFAVEKSCIGAGVLRAPGDIHHFQASGEHRSERWHILAEGGGLGFLFLRGFHAQLWKRKTDCNGVASWVLGRTVELDKLLSLNSEKQRERPRILGFAEDNNVVLLWTSLGVFTVQFESLQFKKVLESSAWYDYFPFEGVYAAGIQNCILVGEMKEWASLLQVLPFCMLQPSTQHALVKLEVEL